MALPGINGSAVTVLDAVASAPAGVWLSAADVAADVQISRKGVRRARLRLRQWGLIEESGTHRDPVVRATSVGRLLIDAFHGGEVIDGQ